MKTVACLEQTPLYITRLSPWNPRSPTLHPTAMKHPYLPKRIIKVNAKAKGFTRAPAKEPNIIPKGTVERESQRNDDDNDEKIPEVVIERMIVRILLNVGVPLVTGIALLQGFGAVKEHKLWDVPVWLPFLTTFLTFGASALGIAYGTLSTSWDPEVKGSLLGFEEAQKNWVEMWREDDENNR